MDTSNVVVEVLGVVDKEYQLKTSTTTKSEAAALIHSTKRKEVWLIKPWIQDWTKYRKIEKAILNDLKT